MPLRKPADVALARKAATAAMEAISASPIKRTKFVTAVSEIARNAIVHAGGGSIRFRLSGDGNTWVAAECRDAGPGIPDVDLALRDGFTTARGMGLGLGGAKRLVDRFDIRTEVGKGTTVTLEARAR
ncbi:MAG: ATP-binding protein [Pararhizobium sp.]